MKKIVEISIDNYKAYVQEQTIKLPNGENMLIYGENGSGKSSLFHALHHFLQSSVDPSKTFDLNVFSLRNDGKIKLVFKDYDTSSRSLDDGSKTSFIVCETPVNSTNVQSFIKLGYRFSGFLDYSQLLKVYLNKGAHPNLFELINDLIGEYIPTSYGFAEPLKDIFDSIHRSMRKSYQRTNRSYVSGKAKFESLQIAYPQIINALDAKFSALMSKYFSDFKMNLNLVGTTILLDESGRVRDTQIQGSVYIEVKHHGVILPEYNNRLNEARLSAIAICLYLASMQLKNQNADLKLLHLDDVFIGLDSANRRPILNMIRNEFTDYQIVISTYDKSWYRLAKEILNDSKLWKCYEFYEGVTTIGGNKVVKPVVIEGETDIDKARVYLYDVENPDYPASANYMRKAFEKLLSKKMYQPAVKDDNLESIPAYKIPSLIDKAKVFLYSLAHDYYAPVIIGLLDQLTTYLKPLLHPLSHYAPDEPVYKQELIDALDVYERLSAALKEANYGARLKPIVSRDSKLKFVIKGATWEQEYTLHAEYDMYRYVDSAGNKCLSLCPMRVLEIKETDITTRSVSKKTITKGTNNLEQFRYNGIDDCVSRITAFLDSSASGKNDRIVLNPITDMFFLPKIKKMPKPAIEYADVLTGKL